MKERYEQVFDVKMKALALVVFISLMTAGVAASVDAYNLNVEPQEVTVGEEVEINFDASATGDDKIGDMMARWPGTSFSDNSIWCGAKQCTSDTEFSWTYTPQSAGQKEIVVKASDYFGDDTDTEDAYVQVNSDDQQPIAAFSYYPEDIETGDTVTFNADCSGSTDLFCARDPDGGEIQMYKWDMNGDGDYNDEVDRSGSSLTYVSRSFESSGTYTVGLKVKDDEGTWSDRFEQDISVEEEEDPNERPHAGFTYYPNDIETGDTVTFNALCSSGPADSCSYDSDGSISEYMWDLDNDGSFDDASGSISEKSFSSAGEKTVKLKVKDDDGATSDVATVDFDVSRPTNQDPEADFKISNSNPDPGATVTFDAKCITDGPCASDPDGTIESYEWDLDGDGSYDDRSGDLVTESFSSTTEVGLKVTDNDGASDTKRKTVRVSEFSIVDKGPSGSVDNPVGLYVDLDSNPSTGWCKWEKGFNVDRSSSNLMSKPDSSDPEWRSSVDFGEGFQRVSFQCFNRDTAITGEKTTTFNVERDIDRDLSVTLFEPVDAKKGLDLRPQFTFQGSYGDRDGNQDLTYVLKVERGRYSDPFSLPDEEKSITLADDERGSMTLNSDLSQGTWYSWGIRVKHDGERVDSAVRTFKTRTADRDTCSKFSNSDLRPSLENFESIAVEGNSYSSRAEMMNNGDSDVGGNLGIYIKESSSIMDCEYHDNNFDDLVALASGNVYPDLGSSDSYSFSYSGNPPGGLSYGENYQLVGIFETGSKTYVGPLDSIQWQRAEDDDRRPTARFSWDDHPAVVGETVRFDGSGSSDPDGDIVEHRWNFDDSTGFRYGQTKTHTFNSPGTYDVSLRVKDSKDNTDSVTRSVRVVERPGECSVNVGGISLGKDVIESGSSTQASVSVNNNGDAQEFEVKFKVGGNTVRTVDRQISADSSSTFTASVSPQQDSIVAAVVRTEGEPCGERKFSRYTELSVVPEDDDDDDEEDRRPDAAFGWTPSQPKPGQTVRFDASDSSDPDGDIVQYKWFFGDGNVGYGRNVQHSFGSKGDYDVQLVVKDSKNNEDSVTRTVPVVRDRGACSVRVSPLRFGDTIIQRGESTSASVTVSNLGDEQVFNLEFRSGGNTVEQREVVVQANSQRTFTTSVSPSTDSVITAEVSTESDPCGFREYKRSKELVVVEGSTQERPKLEVNVESAEGRRLYNARVRVEGPSTLTRYTGPMGEAFFQLDEGDYDITISKSGYGSKFRNLQLQRGDDRSITVTLDENDQRGTLVALVEDSSGERISNAEVTVQNGITETRNTNSNGRASINLDTGTYTVSADKQGYRSRSKTVDIEEGEDTTEVFRLSEQGGGLDIGRVDYPSTVCRGSTMRADVTIENDGGYHEFVSLTGSGLGSINAVSSFSLESGETTTKTVYFENVRGSGNEEFTVTVNNQQSDQVSRTVEVESCRDRPSTGPSDPSDISLTVSYTVKPNQAITGDILKVDGFVDGAEGRTTVDIKIDGQVKTSVRTQPDGYYQTWISAEEVGVHTITASTGDVSDSKPLRVLPTATVSNMRVPVNKFEGQSYQVCADVESRVVPKVLLERDGEIVSSKKQKGEVCFDRDAREPGIHQYRVVALTSGKGASETRSMEVLEMGVEASSFPDQVASVESGSGIVKVELYNTNEGQTRYDLDLEGLPSTWISQSEKQVILDKAERRTVYFYLTPQEEGSYRPTISVNSRGSEIYREELDLITGGTKDSNPDQGFFGNVWEGVTGALPF